MKNKSDIRKEQEVFKVPENYFDEFQARMSEVDRLASPKAGFNTGKILVRSAYLVPAMILIVVAGLFFFPDSSAPANDLAGISTDDLISYLEEDGITEEELLSYMEGSLPDYEMGSFGSDQLLEDIEPSDLEDLSEELDLLNDYL